MKEYYNPIVTLEEEKAPKPELHEDNDDFLDEFLLDDIMNVEPLCSAEILLEEVKKMNEEQAELDKQEETEHRFIRTDAPRNFCFMKSWHKVYYDLKEDNPERALHYLEGLIDFGVLGVEPPRVGPEDRLVYNLLDGPMHVIDKAYLDYLNKKAADLRNREREREKKMQEEREKKREMKRERRRRNG